MKYVVRGVRREATARQAELRALPGFVLIDTDKTAVWVEGPGAEVTTSGVGLMSDFTIIKMPLGHEYCRQMGTSRHNPVPPRQGLGIPRCLDGALSVTFVASSLPGALTGEAPRFHIAGLCFNPEASPTSTRGGVLPIRVVADTP